MTDSEKDIGRRRRMVQELKEKGICSEEVLQAFLQVPRHCFVPSFLYAHAYEDHALPIACGQTISQPSTVARQTQLLEVRPKQKILEIGTGTGFQAAILKAMGAYVYSVERQADLYRETGNRLRELHISIAMKHADGYRGWKEFAPFDRILLTCAVPEVPQELLEQLKPGGILLAPVGQKMQTMTKIVRDEHSGTIVTTHGTFQFVPMLQDKTFLK